MYSVIIHFSYASPLPPTILKISCRCTDSVHSWLLFPLKFFVVENKCLPTWCPPPSLFPAPLPYSLCPPSPPPPKMCQWQSHYQSGNKGEKQLDNLMLLWVGSQNGFVWVVTGNSFHKLGVYSQQRQKLVIGHKYSSTGQLPYFVEPTWSYYALLGLFRTILVRTVVVMLSHLKNCSFYLQEQYVRNTLF